VYSSATQEVPELKIVIELSDPDQDIWRWVIWEKERYDGWNIAWLNNRAELAQGSAKTRAKAMRQARDTAKEVCELYRVTIARNKVIAESRYEEKVDTKC